MNCLDLGPFDCAHVNILARHARLDFLGLRTIDHAQMDWLDLGQLIMLRWIGYVLCARLDCLHVSIDYMFLIRLCVCVLI